jgi:predicted transcriptional regulator
MRRSAKEAVIPAEPRRGQGITAESETDDGRRAADESSPGSNSSAANLGTGLSSERLATELAHRRIRRLDQPDFYVLDRILSSLPPEGDPIRPTRLQCGARTSYTQSEEYLALLEACGLLQIVRDSSGARWVAITDKGKRARDAISEAMSYLGRGHV